MWSKIILFKKKKVFFCARWTLFTHFGTHLFGVPLAACRGPLGIGTGFGLSVRAILRVATTKIRWSRVDEARSTSHSNHVAQDMGYFFSGGGLSAVRVHKLWGFLGPFGGGSPTYCGVRGP